MKILLASALLIVSSTYVYAGNCGNACQKCAAEMGYVVDAKGDLNRRSNNASANMAWDGCLERARAANASGKK